MSAWRRIAIERLPTLQKQIAAAEGPYSVWGELLNATKQAYAQEPFDDALIAAIYGYGDWCVCKSHNSDLATAALFCFYEHIPTDPPLRADVGRWMSVEDFHGLRNIFQYHLSEAEMDIFTQEFLAQKKRLAEGKPLLRWQDMIVPSPRKKRKTAAG